MTRALATVTGRTTAKPELRYTQNGKAVSNFTLAHTPRRKNAATGEWEDEETLFLRVTVWGPLAENVAHSVGKGDAVTVSGDLGVKYYQTQAGENRLDVTLTAETVAVDLRFQLTDTSRVSRQDAPPASITDARSSRRAAATA